MEEYEIIKTIFDKAKEFFFSKFQEKGAELKEKREKEENLDKYYSSAIVEISNGIKDEWESEKIIEYVTQYAPITVGENYSIFSDEMRQEFIETFYKEASIFYRSEKINDALNQYLDNLDKYIDWKLPHKLIYNKMLTLEKGQGRVEKIACDIFSKLKGQPENENQLEHMARMIRLRVSAFLECYLDKQLRMYEDINDDEFNEQIYYSQEIFRNTWKTKIVQLLKVGCNEKSDTFWEKLKIIENNQEYEIIIKYAKTFLSEYDWNEKVRKQFIDEIRYPKFNKVFLISGEMGTGKTLFVRNFIKSNLQNFDMLIIPLSISKLLEKSDLNKTFLEVSNMIMDMHCSDFTEIVERLQSLNYRICILIENIHELYIYDKRQFENIINLVKLYTKYDNVNWIFTVNEYEYFIFETIPQFLNRYCFGNKNIDRNFLKNSFNLREYNIEHNVVTRILDFYNVELIKDEVMDNLQFNRPVEIPLYAHILGKCYEGEKILSYPETYFDYIKVVAEIFNKKIGGNVYYKELVEAEKKILQIMKDTNRITYNEEEMREIGKHILDELEIIHLLSYEDKCDNDIYNFNQFIISRKYVLRVEVFWAFKFILYCQSVDDETIDISKELLRFPQNFRDILLPCYLMFIDDNTNILPKVLEELFLSEAGCYPLFCSRKASLKFEKTVYEHLSCITLQNNIKVIYALLYYLYYCKLKIKEKFLLICKNAQNIIDSGLKDIYENLIGKIVFQVTNENSMKNNMLFLVPCQVSELNHINGYVCGGRYVQILKESGKSFKNGIRNLEMYIYSRTEVISVISIKGGNNTSFMDFFVRGFFEKYLRENDLKDLFDFLHKNRYFDIEPPIGDFFKRNFTCAAGNVYSQKLGLRGYTKQYENMVNMLSMSSERYDNFTAGFLICNSIGEDDRGINIELIPAFVRLWAKDDFKEKFKTHKEVNQIFTYNCDDLSNYMDIE